MTAPDCCPPNNCPKEGRLSVVETEIKAMKDDLKEIKDGQRRIFERLDNLAELAAMGRGMLGASLRWGGIVTVIVSGTYALTRLKFGGGG